MLTAIFVVAPFYISQNRNTNVIHCTIHTTENYEHREFMKLPWLPLFLTWLKAGKIERKKEHMTTWLSKT